MRARSVIADPGIQIGVTQIDQQIDQYKRSGEDHDGALDHGKIARFDAIDQQSAQTRPGKDGLGDDCAAEKIAESQADDGDDGNQGVLQGMTQEITRSFSPLARAVRT